MTAKKQWLKKICQDSQELKSSQQTISWSSSDSDEDVFDKYIHTKKKKKVNNNNKIAENWVKTFETGTCNQKEYFEKINPCSSNFQFSNNLSGLESNSSSPEHLHNLNNNNKIKEINSVEYIETTNNSPQSRHNCDSPIINSLKVEELSPVLIQNPDNIDLTKEVSPILGKRGILKKIRSKHKNNKAKQQIFKSTTTTTSPDLFMTQSTQLIECDSPEICTKDNLFPIKSSTSPSTECILPFPSQCSSQVKISDTSSSLSRTDNSSLYHQPVRRKKNYKKGGLASLLQKALHLQRTRILIWQHEIYTKKDDDVVDRDKQEVVEFVIKKEWKEYGSTLLECDNKCSNLVSSTNMESHIFIIIISHTLTLNISCKLGYTYKLIPPYSNKNIIYNSKETPCYFNVTKLILCKAEQPT